MNFSFEIRDADDCFHDRKLITNNVYVVCGKGFDLFPIKPSSKSTDISISFPDLDSSHDIENKKSYYSLLRELAMVQYGNKYGKHIWSESNMENRLITHYKEYLSNNE